MERKDDESNKKSHILLLPYPAQGHINPMLQFGKRLASHNHDVTLANTRFLSDLTKPDLAHFSVEYISDGFDSDGFGAAPNIQAYLDRLESVGSETLSDLIESLRSKGRPVHVLVYDPFLAWALDVANRFGLRSAAFFTQSCAVDTIYGHVWEGRLELPVMEPVRLPGVGSLEPRDLPSYLTDLEPVPYPDYFVILVNQYKNLEKTDMVLINSFYELEHKEFDWMKSRLPVKSIGPTLPSTYLDNRIPWDSHYGFNLHTPDTASYLEWLDSKPPNSVIYVSFGSMASLSPDQTNEIASGLIATNKSFIWVVRTSELAKLPANFTQEISGGQGLVVSWCNQLDVLAHNATGCFVTHCGWNSTMEGIGLGVPMVGVPQWTDQPTDAKYIEDVWKVGLRAKSDNDKGFVNGEELKRCIMEVMDGERSGEIRENAAKWSKLAKESVSEGGSSDKSIKEFIDQCCK